MQASTTLLFGCMSLGGSWDNSPLTEDDKTHAFDAIEASLNAGITQFDHADIYKRGKAEQVFGEFLQASHIDRDTLFVQSKCGIQLPTETLGTRYNLSKEWIINSCKQSLERLKLDYLDSFLLHRPDPLMRAEEVAEALHQLFDEGLVKRFGASNMTHNQLAHLNSHLSEQTRLQYNQLELNLFDTRWLDSCVDFNRGVTTTAHSAVYDTLLYCQDNDIAVQAWGSLAQGKFAKSDISPNKQQCQQLLQSLTEHYQCDINALQLAWLMQLPFTIQPVIGTANPARISACRIADHITLSREHWFALYEASRDEKLP